MSSDIQTIKHRVSSLFTTVSQTENTDQVEALENKVRELLDIITDMKGPSDTNEKAAEEKPIQALHASQPLKQFSERPDLNCSKQSSFLEEAMQKQKSKKWSWFGTFDSANMKQKQEYTIKQNQQRVFSIPQLVFAVDNDDDVSSTECSDVTDSERVDDPHVITCVSPAAAHKRIKNRDSLHKLNRRMSTTIGVGVSPECSAFKKKRLSLRERRIEMALARAKLQESFNSALSQPPLSS